MVYQIFQIFYFFNNLFYNYYLSYDSIIYGNYSGFFIFGFYIKFDAVYLKSIYYLLNFFTILIHSVIFKYKLIYNLFF